METTRQHLEKVVHAVVRRELQRANTRDEEAVRNAQEVARAMAESADTNPFHQAVLEHIQRIATTRKRNWEGDAREQADERDAEETADLVRKGGVLPFGTPSISMTLFAEGARRCAPDANMALNYALDPERIQKDDQVMYGACTSGGIAWPTAACAPHGRHMSRAM